MKFIHAIASALAMFWILVSGAAPEIVTPIALILFTTSTFLIGFYCPRRGARQARRPARRKARR